MKKSSRAAVAARRTGGQVFRNRARRQERPGPGRRMQFFIETNGGMVLLSRRNWSSLVHRAAPVLLLGIALAVLGNLFMMTRTVTLRLDDAYDTMATITTDPLVVAQNSMLVPEEDDLFEVSGSGRVIDIRMFRKFPVSVSADGETTEVWTYGTNVRELFLLAGVEVGEKDVANYPFEQKIERTAELSLTRWRSERVVTEEVIPYSVQRMGLGSGTANVRYTKGKNGLKRVVLEKEYLGDELVGTTVVSEEIIRKPVDSVAVVLEGGTLSTSRSATTRYSYVLDMLATAYTYGENGPWGNVTATGKPVQVGRVAVDPKVIPLGSRLYITYPNGNVCYGFAVAEDTGGAIKGNRIDLFFETRDEVYSFGRRNVKVYVLDD